MSKGSVRMYRFEATSRDWGEERIDVEHGRNLCDVSDRVR